jgi:hypothetical protein
LHECNQKNHFPLGLEDAEIVRIIPESQGKDKPACNKKADSGELKRGFILQSDFNPGKR